jgi:hypothetical protein
LGSAILTTFDNTPGLYTVDTPFSPLADTTTTLIMAELMFGLGQTKKKKETEQKVRYTKATLKDVSITETVESNVRADQHGRE